MNDTDRVAQWQADLDALAAQSPNRFVRYFPPRIVVRRGRFSPRWLPLPLLWLDTRPNAYTFWNRIIVSASLLDCPLSRRHYLLSHEYGHLRALHPVWGLLAMGVMLVSALLQWRVGPHAPLVASVARSVSMLAVLAILWLLWVGEYQADAFAVKVCGRQTVIDGMLWLARTSGRGVTPMLRKRLRKLGHVASSSE
jgi:Zn-dependent protease with chaperone function